MVKIRELTIDDYDALCALWEEAGLPFRPNGRDQRERIAREIEGPCSVFLIAEDEGNLVGAILGTHDGRKGWINRVAVDPDHRGRGLGGKMIAACERFLRQRGATVIGCLIEEHNLPSMALFQKHGYCFYEGVMYFSKRDSEES